MSQKSFLSQKNSQKFSAPLRESKATGGTMFLSKHKNGFYYIYYRNQDGKRLSVSTKTKLKSEAYKALTRFSIERKNKKYEGASTTLNKFRWEFLKASESYHSWKTTLDYRSTFNELEKVFGNVQLTELTRKGIEEFIQKKIRDHSLYTGRRCLINIKALLNKAVSLNYIQHNPATHIKRIQIPERLPIFFTKEEFQTLLHNIDNSNYKDVIEFAVNTGLRQMEILTLTKKQFDVDKRIIILDNHHHTTKSKKVRAVPLNDKAFAVLLRREGDLLFSQDGKAISADQLESM